MLGKLKYYLKRNINIKSGYTLAIGIISIFLVVGGFSFAIFTATTEQKGVLNIVTGNLYSLLESDLLNTSNSISVPASSSKTFYIRIKNVNTIDAKFNLYYTKVEGVNVYYTTVKETAPTTSGVVISAGTKREIEVVIDNTTTSSKTITFGSDVGLSNKPLTFPVGKEVIIKLPTAVETLLKKVNPVEVVDYNAGNKQEMFTFKHTAGEQQVGYTEEELTDYRYIGNTPNNYVTFNNEVWRIIGVFTVENGSGVKEKRIKIVRDEPIGDYSWDTSESTINDGYGINEWSQADLMKLLNPGHTGTGGSLYYNKQSGTCYSNYKNATKACDFTTTGLSEEAKGMIGDTKWWLEGNSTNSGHSGPTYYAFERGNTVLQNPPDSITRTTSLIGKIGLMYPSDYAYTYANGVDNKCYTDTYNCESGTPIAGWLFNNKKQWLKSPFSSIAQSVFYITTTGYVGRGDNSSNAFGLRPSLYLKFTIEIINGDGTITNPYTLKI